MDISAIMGFMNSLMDIIKREKTDNLAAAFDNGWSDIRNEIFIASKAKRHETQESIRIAELYIQEFLNDMNFPIVDIAGF